MKKRLFKLLLLMVTVSTMGISVNTSAEQLEKDKGPCAGISKDIVENLQQAFGEASQPMAEDIVLENPYAPYTPEEAYLLGKIAMAEAEGEDTIGKAMVICTVLNRVQSAKFPDTIKEVIYQKGQFQPLDDGRWNEVEPDDDCWEAFYMVVHTGEDFSKGALYFEATYNMNDWHKDNCEFLFQHGKHYFYR